MKRMKLSIIWIKQTAIKGKSKPKQWEKDSKSICKWKPKSLINQKSSGRQTTKWPNTKNMSKHRNVVKNVATCKIDKKAKTITSYMKIMRLKLIWIEQTAIKRKSKQTIARRLSKIQLEGKPKLCIHQKSSGTISHTMVKQHQQVKIL